MIAVIIAGCLVGTILAALWFDGWRTDRKYRREMELVERKARGCWERWK